MDEPAEHSLHARPEDGPMTTVRLITAAIASVVVGCGSPSSAPVANQGSTTTPATSLRLIRAAAASDLQSTLPEVVSAYERANPGDRVEVVFGASGKLASQIEAGAPFDVFLSANAAFPKALDASGLLRRPPEPYAIGSIVLAVGPRAQNVTRLDDLKKPDVKAVAIANPDVAPYGAAARAALRAAGVWDAIEPKVVRAENVGQALRYVASGEAEAGLVSKSSSATEGVRFIDVDPSLYDPIVQSLAVVRGPNDMGSADRFAGFVLGDSGRAILQAHGFRLPERSTAAAKP
jgi:molybdate transport system substrate-binding protein